MSLSVDIRKIFKSIVTSEVVVTPGDQFSGYLHQLGIYRDLIEQNIASTMNSRLGVLSLAEFERNQANIIDLTALIAESRASYRDPKVIYYRKLFGKIPIWKKS